MGMGSLGAGAVVTLIGGLLLLELPAVASWAVVKLSRAAVAQLPSRLREIKREEWAAELDAMKASRVAKILLALSFLRAAKRLAQVEAVGLRAAQDGGRMLHELALLGYELVDIHGEQWLRHTAIPRAETMILNGKTFELPATEALWRFDDTASLPSAVREALRSDR